MDGLREWMERPGVRERLRPIAELHAVLLEMLKVIDRVCADHGLRYYLFYGTLLGAMRYNGFIPWDDDADIVMPRADYDRLVRLPKEVWPEGYFLQSPYSEATSRFAFCKLRKNGTACIAAEHMHIKMHQGVFVDIFPLDEVRGNGFWLWNVQRSLERLTAFSCARLPKRMRILRPLQWLWMLLFKPSFFSRIADASARVLAGKGDTCMAPLTPYPPGLMAAGRKGWNKSMFEPACRHGFCGIELNVPHEADKILTSLYGNWRAVPDEDRRLPLHSNNGILDLTRDYSFYIGKDRIRG